MLAAIFCFNLVIVFHFGSQINIQKEYSGVIREWRENVSMSNTTLDQLCGRGENSLKINFDYSKLCNNIFKYYNISDCPPGLKKISKGNNEYCYEIQSSSEWNYPCLKSGGASVITDLIDEDVNSLLNSLRYKNISRFFWLPAKRTKFLGQVQWHIPGPKWGHFLQSNNSLRIQTSIFQNCLLLDIEQALLKTETCTREYPNLCFYMNDIYYPAKCPDKYHSVRHMPNEGICIGIEYSPTNISYNDFINNNICKRPMGNEHSKRLTRIMFQKIGEFSNLSDDAWCWFASLHSNMSVFDIIIPEIYMSINNAGSLSFSDASSSIFLPCMACQTEPIYYKTELIFQYYDQENVMYLTIYYPSGLWKYSENDRGIQCFSDAKGFIEVIDVKELSVFDTLNSNDNFTSESDSIDMITYTVHLVNSRAAQYWCEGHTQDFSLIRTGKVVVNPQGNDVHVFSLVIKIHVSRKDIENILKTVQLELCSNITNIFQAKKVVLMEYLKYSSNYLMVLFHMDIAIENNKNDSARNIEHTYNILNQIAKTELQNYNYILVNISSSIYCLPTTTTDISLVLNWELTSIGHVAAPNQFCLQENGLPVRRMCSGSFLLGSYWNDVDGTCNQNYQPSHTTTFLYNFVKGQIPDDNASSFLTHGLEFVLSEIDNIIPADIYYLSMSLKHFLNLAQQNDTSVELGNIDHIAWVMDRVTTLDNSYLRLAQTLNSTNVILDSVNHIIEILAAKTAQSQENLQRLDKNYYTKFYQLAIQPQFIIQISYPSVNNISGLAIIRNSPNREDFLEIVIKPLFKNTTLDEVLSIHNLEVATWLPERVLKSLKRTGNYSNSDEVIDDEDMHIIINVFHNDAIFQEQHVDKYKVNSRILGVSIPGFSSNFEKPMPLIYKHLAPPHNEHICGYWDFNVNAYSSAPGYWSNSGCYIKETKNDLTLCDCYHLTHFGQLLNIASKDVNQSSHEKTRHNTALNIISLVGSFLSLIGITGIWITASVFQAWRKKAGTKVLLHLSASIALPLIFMMVFNLDNTIIRENNGSYEITQRLKPACIVLGALLHYSVLATFMWMLITAVLQFIRYVRVLGVYRPSRCMLKFTLVGWGIPIIPVSAVLILDADNYVPHLVNKESKYSICYPSGFYMIVSIIAPIAIILIINISLFILVICAISKGPDGKLRSSDVDLIGTQLRLSVFLFFLLGLTWIFGLFSFSSNPLWSYLFCLTSTLQGFVLFVYFIICDSQTRNLWVTLIKPQFRVSSSRASITTLGSD